jgi:hypothetical protein
MKLFAGLDRAYGTYKIEDTKESGKRVGRAVTKKEQLTLELWSAHLEGKQGIGVVPIMDDNCVFFGAIDIDAYKNFDLQMLARKVAEFNFPLVLCRSKSGGAHLYMFSEAAVPAGEKQDQLREMADTLGYYGCEIFPKQREILADRGDVGGWINMPYFNADDSERYALDGNGNKMTAEEFLSLAEETRQKVYVKPAPKEDESFNDGPPCLQRLCEKGFGEGSRNDCLIQIAVYEKLKCGSEGGDWKTATRGWNFNKFSPPLPDDEVSETVLKSASRKNYKYMCAREPFKGVCDAAVCRSRKFGVGRFEENGPNEDAPPAFPVLSQLRKRMTTPPTWFWEVNGKAIELTTDELQSPRLFQKRCMEDVDLMIPIPSQTSWQRCVTEAMKHVIHIEEPEDASLIGKMWYIVERFCTSQDETMTRDGIINGKIRTEGDRTWFLMNHLLSFLERNSFKELTTHKITSELKKRGATHDRWKIRGKLVSVWSLPTFKQFENRPEGENDGTAF